VIYVYFPMNALTLGVFGNLSKLSMPSILGATSFCNSGQFLEINPDRSGLSMMRTCVISNTLNRSTNIYLMFLLSSDIRGHWTIRPEAKLLISSLEPFNFTP